MKRKYLVVAGGVLFVAVATQLISQLNDHSHAAPAAEEVEAHIPPPMTQQEIGIAIARRGSALHADQKYREAVLAFDSAAESLPHIRDWLNVFAAGSLSFLGDTAAVAARLQTVDSAIANDWAWRLRARAFQKAGSISRALDIASAATLNGPASRRASAWFVVSELQRDMLNPSAQRAALLRAIEIAPVAEGAADAARVLAGFNDLTSYEHLQAGRALLRNGEVRRGVAELQAYVARSEEVSARDEVRYEIGRALFNIGEYGSAERELALVSNSHPRAADARYLLGRAQYRQRKVTEGVNTLKSVAAEFDQSAAAARALFLLGDLAQDEGRTSEAVSYFNQTVARSSGNAGDEPAHALMRLGAIRFVARDFAGAEQTFEEYRQRYPRGAAYEQATYWSAQAAAAAGNQDAARERWQNLRGQKSLSYYNVRAAALLGEQIIADMPEGPSRETEWQDQIDRALDRHDTLRKIGWNDAAAFELGALRANVANDTSAIYAVAEGLNKRGHAYLAIAVGRELLNSGRGWDERLLRIMYPLPFEDIIKRESQARGLDPYFVAALMRQESRFNARAVSGAGAIGLMQVMPATGRQLGNATREQLMDPAVNIRLGTKFLADLTSIYGRADAVLAAYNAGPSRMTRWRSFPEYAQPDLFIERIPFDETRDYVKVVHVNTSIYRALYSE
jgi:soluble lytic murein transglycosylase